MKDAICKKIVFRSTKTKGCAIGIQILKNINTYKSQWVFRQRKGEDIPHIIIMSD